MNPFDSAILNYINQYSQCSWAVDTTAIFVSSSPLLKGGVLLTVFWWGWFRVNKYQPYVRVHLVSTLFSCFVAMIMARALGLLLPFRIRPLYEGGLDFTLPHGMDTTVFETWSSFPSDHAVLFYALSTGMFYISRKVGLFALVYTTLAICLPRLYLGLHYPTDIIAGAFVGIVIALLCNSNTFIEKITQSVTNNLSAKPQVFYPVLLIVTYQITDMFDSSRALVLFLVPFVQTLFA